METGRVALPLGSKYAFKALQKTQIHVTAADGRTVTCSDASKIKVKCLETRENKYTFHVKRVILHT